MSLNPSLVPLASWKGWNVSADFETACVGRLDGARWKVGEMYGNPQAALVTVDEKYVVLIGCGFIVADLSRFGEPIRNAEEWEKSAAVHRLALPNDIWWFEAVYEPGDEGVMQLIADMSDKHAGVYELRLPNLALTPLLTRSPGPES